MFKIKRPLFIITIGYILGIIIGLSVKKIALIFFIILINLNLLFFIKKSKNKNIKKIKKYLKIILKKKIIIIFIIFLILSFFNIKYLENKYEKTNNNLINKNEYYAEVISDKKEKEYYNEYIIKLNKSNIKLLLYVPKENKILNFGDIINFNGEYTKPNIARNYKGFNYSNYLKTKKIYGIVKANKVNIISKNNINILKINNEIKNKINNNINKILPEKTRKCIKRNFIRR